MDKNAEEASVTLAPAGDNVVSLDFFSIPDETSFHLSDDDLEDKFVMDSLCAGLQLQVEVTDVVKGKTSEGKPATLILLRLRFYYFTNKRRLESVNVELKFFDSMKRPVYTPRIHTLWPDGNYILDEYEFKIEQKNNWNLGLSVQPPHSPASVNAGRSWEKTASDKRAVDRAWLTGGSFGEGKLHNGIHLFTAENKQSGVVPDIRASVLLQHRDEDETEICAQAKVSAEAGMWFQTQWKLRNLGASQAIKPSVFTQRSSGLSADVNPLELDKADFEKLSGVPPKKVIDRVEEKHQYQGYK